MAENSVTAWFQASAAKQMGIALVGVIMQRVAVISYRRFGTTCRSHLQGLRNSSEERSSQLLDYLCRFPFPRNSEILKPGEGCLTSSTVSHPDEMKVRWSEEGGLNFLAQDTVRWQTLVIRTGTVVLLLTSSVTISFSNRILLRAINHYWCLQ